MVVFVILRGENSHEFAEGHRDYFEIMKRSGKPASLIRVN
tara:strand:- start:4187 stop:4306 length:120 start_codon:yes stop_codon:yes gene_type:complete